MPISSIQPFVSRVIKEKRKDKHGSVLCFITLVWKVAPVSANSAVKSSGSKKQALYYYDCWDLMDAQCLRPQNSETKHTHTPPRLNFSWAGCLKLTDRGYLDELIIFIRALRTWPTPTNSSLTPTFKSPPEAQELKATSRDSLGTLDQQHIWPRPEHHA